ncbi:MAG: UvrB/UvrC motif-containing protein [bacterium]
MVLPASLQWTLDNLPEDPGVYRLRDLRGEVLYIGKSCNLRDRVRTYFHSSPPDRKTSHLRALTKSVDYLVLNTDHQAQEVEWDLIRSYRPEYNTLFLDYWNRPYVRITVEDPYPKIELTQTKKNDGAEYYGPYKSTRRLRMMLTALRETFPVRDCQLEIPPGGAPDELDRCMEADLSRCTAPCVGNEDVTAYRERLEDVRRFLGGNYQTVINKLTDKMDEASRRHNYEAASIYRDRLEAVKNLVHYEPFIRETLDLDVWDRYGNCVVMLSVREHRLKRFEVFHGKSFRRFFHNRYADAEPTVDVVTGETFVEPDDYREYCRSPETGEEESLLDAAGRTARSHAGEETIGSSAGVVDELTVDNTSVRFRRTINGRSEKREISVRNPTDVLKSTVIPTYQNDMEKGRLLPDCVLLRLEEEIKPNEENLFRDTRFWFPIHLE